MIVTLDFETFWSQDYSLTKMSEVDYILSPRFEPILCGIKLGAGETRVARGPAAIRDALGAIDWNRVALLCHNTRFDGAILAWRYGFVPGLYLDTLSMARGWTHAYTGSSALDAVARYYQLAPKGTQAQTYKGRWFAGFTKAELDDYAAYCAHDTELCRLIFDRMLGEGFPHRELALIDLNIRKFVRPGVKLDEHKLAEHLAKVRGEKAQALAQLAGIDKGVFSSNQKFAALLASEGVEVPSKRSPATGQMVPALARNDPEFKELCEDTTQTPRVQAMLAVRLGVKSTIEETRAETLLNLARAFRSACMPVPYNYYGAHTGRFSGAGGFNFTNLKRGSELRAAIRAPDAQNWRIVHRDASQIEARLCAWLAGCDTLTEAFRQGRDIYSEFASLFYERPISKSDTQERFVGKTVILSLGYGSGAARLKTTLYLGDRQGLSVDVSTSEAEALKTLYRETYNEIPMLWRRGNATINLMLGLPAQAHAYQPIPVIEVGENHKLVLPNGMALRYPNLRQEYDGQEKLIVYDCPPTGAKKIYGAKLIENICQALARIIVTDIELRVYEQTGYHPFMSTYDSHEYVVPTSEVRDFDVLLTREFARVPSWAPGLPLASEGGFGITLADAERGANN